MKIFSVLSVALLSAVVGAAPAALGALANWTECEDGIYVSYYCPPGHGEKDDPLCNRVVLGGECEEQTV
jgi:hypothetical protein